MYVEIPTTVVSEIRVKVEGNRFIGFTVSLDPNKDILVNISKEDFLEAARNHYGLVEE